jgi:para-aminobenzoate synthetase / 4-amino-4-deoxychorismate lyase
VIEARFDDLTGAEPSFRLTEPIGVLEATRLEEVASVIDAAEGAATRGLWVAGFVSYEAAPGLDPSLRVRMRQEADPFARLPLAWFAMFERREETQLPEAPGGSSPDQDAWRPSVDRARYDVAIATIREHIAAGDTYQVNHTLRLRSRIEGDPRGLYRDLCHAQRGAYNAYLHTGRYRILSASPELFFRIDGDRITCRPMKGTAARGRWPAEDEQVRRGLAGSVKDRAENAMIVDLIRNDLGRVARMGSVRWDDVFAVERYETVWQLTSTVAATLPPHVRLLDVFRALFPSGSVTGAPKVSTMGIIADLEDSPRGVYCGAVGYLAPTDLGPAARFNVPIRTVMHDTETSVAEYGVGGGITWDSSAQGEFDETVAKARVLVARRPRFDLLESVGCDPDVGLRRLDGHLARLSASAEYFGFAFDDGVVREALQAEAARFSGRSAKIRLLLDRRGHVQTGGAPMSPSEGPVRLSIDTGHAVDPGDVLLFHKTSLRGTYEGARARHPDADDTVLVNTRGEVTETTTSNLAVQLDGRWWTPPLDAGLLPGCERTALLAEGVVDERSLTIDDLRRATEIAVLNSVRGWRAAVVVG